MEVGDGVVELEDSVDDDEEDKGVEVVDGSSEVDDTVEYASVDEEEVVCQIEVDDWPSVDVEVDNVESDCKDVEVVSASDEDPVDNDDVDDVLELDDVDDVLELDDVDELVDGELDAELALASPLM